MLPHAGRCPWSFKNGRCAACLVPFPYPPSLPPSPAVPTRMSFHRFRNNVLLWGSNKIPFFFFPPRPATAPGPPAAPPIKSPPPKKWHTNSKLVTGSTGRQDSGRVVDFQIRIWSENGQQVSVDGVHLLFTYSRDSRLKKYTSTTQACVICRPCFVDDILLETCRRNVVRLVPPPLSVLSRFHCRPRSPPSLPPCGRSLPVAVSR